MDDFLRKILFYTFNAVLVMASLYMTYVLWVSLYWGTALFTTIVGAILVILVSAIVWSIREYFIKKNIKQAFHISLSCFCFALLLLIIFRP